MKRSLEFLLALLLTLTVCPAALAEASQPLTDLYPEFATPHEATILCFEMGWTGPEADLDIVTPELAKRTNFTLKYVPQTVVSDDDLNSKLNLMVASRDVPDIYFGGANNYIRSIYRKLGEADLIWNVADYIKDYPNLYNLIKPELLQYYDQQTKSIYFIPTQNGRGFDAVNSANSDGMFLRDDWLTQLGMEYPTTPETLYDFLVRVRDEIKEVNGQKVIPIILDEDFGGMDNILNMFFPYRDGFNFDRYNNFEPYNYMYSNSEQMKRACIYLNKLYRENLLDREVLTQKRSQFMEKITSGRVGVMNSAWWDMNTFSDQARAVVPELMYCVPPDLYDRTNGYPEHPDEKWTNWVGYWSSLTLSKSMDEEAVRHFMAMLDYLATTEGQMLVQCGIEDYTYKYNEEGKFHFTDEYMEMTSGGDWNKASAYGIFYWQQLVNNYPAYKDLVTRPQELLREDNYKGWQNKMDRWNRYDETMMPLKSQYFVEGEVEVRTMPAIRQARNEMLAKVILAKSEEEVVKIVDEWDVTCKNLGIDDVIAERKAFMDTLVILEDLPD